MPLGRGVGHHPYPRAFCTLPSLARIKGPRFQPRSQGLSSLPPLVVGRKTLVAAGHVPSCDTNFSTGVGSTNNFCRSQLKRKKGPSKFSSPVAGGVGHDSQRVP